MEFQGKWISEHKDDLAKQMKLNGIPDEFVKYASETGIEWVIFKEGDKFVMRHIANMSMVLEEITFQLGKPFQFHNWLGQFVSGVAVMDGDKIVREIQEDNQKCTQTFQKRGNHLQETRVFRGTPKTSYLSFTKA